MLFCIDQSKYKTLIDHTDRLGDLEKNNLALFGAMCKLGVIRDVGVENSMYDQLILRNRMKIFESTSYRLTINPTLNCNFNCWYCYETLNTKKMDKDVVNAIIKFIDNLLKENRFSVFNLDWFGGEPLLGYENIIKPISIAAKELCQRHNVVLESGMTTNGYLLNEDMIPFFKEINMSSFQITLDGKEDVHNTIRFLQNGKKSYDTIVRNIILLAQRLEPENLSLRVNFTKDTFDSIEEIIDSFPLDVRGRITVLLQQVWQDKDQSNITIDKTEELRSKFEYAGFRVNKELFNLRGYTCYADCFNQAVVNYDGRVFKCTATDFEKQTEDGILTENGNIEWSPILLPLRLSKATFENEQCRACNYLPVCFGPCSQKAMAMTETGEFDKYCYREGIEKTLDYVFAKFKETNKALAPLFEYQH